MNIINFIPCVLNPTSTDFLENLGAKPGYYLLKIEEDSQSWASKDTPVHITRYALMKVFEGANSLQAICDGMFLGDMGKRPIVTGYRELGLNDDVKEI